MRREGKNALERLSGTMGTYSSDPERLDGLKRKLVHIHTHRRRLKT